MTRETPPVSTTSRAELGRNGVSHRCASELKSARRAVAVSTE